MKRFLSAVIVMTVMLGALVMPASAKTSEEVVTDVFRNRLFIDDMYKLCEAIDNEDVSAVFMTVLEIYPDIVVMLKKSIANENTNANVIELKNGDRYEKAIAYLTKSTVIFDDMVLLKEKVEQNDPYGIYSVILQIYPDFVCTLKKGMEDSDTPYQTAVGSKYEDPTYADISDGTGSTEKNYSVLWAILSGIAGIVLGGAAVYFIVGKKKERTDNE